MEGENVQQQGSSDCENIQVEKDKNTSADDEWKSEDTIFTYQAPWKTYSLACSYQQPGNSYFRIAVGSFIQEYKNRVQIISLDKGSGANDFRVVADFSHPYPCTKILFIPDASTGTKDLVATTGDYLRIWVNESETVSMLSLLNNNRDSEYCAPLTSFSWNYVNPRVIGTSSIDTTCTIWDIETRQVKTQLIAHDSEVYDITFAKQHEHYFTTVGNDGSVRLFDLRSLEHSTILYENPSSPLIRVGWNGLDQNYLSAIASSKPYITVVDVRRPCEGLKLRGHGAGSVNAQSWAPHSSCHICTGGEDNRALIWDLGDTKSWGDEESPDPILAYDAEAEINHLEWNPVRTDYMAISFANKVQVLRV